MNHRLHPECEGARRQNHVAVVPLVVAHPVVLPAELIHLIARERVTLLLLPRGDDPSDGSQYRVGSRIGLQRHHQETARAWVHILARELVELGQVNDDQALALGHRDRYALQAAWNEARPWRATDQAWMLRIQHDPSAPSRMLHRDSSHGYTDDPRLALPEEPEAVDDFVLAARGRAAHDREHADYEQERKRRRALPLDEQLRLALRDCEARGVPVGGPRNAIAKQIEKLERRALEPADRTRDAEVRPPEDDGIPRRRRRRLNTEAAARRRRERERKKPGPLIVRRIDPETL